MFAELSDVAEACLIVVAKLLASEQLTVIALGKFGGHESVTAQTWTFCS